MAVSPADAIAQTLTALAAGDVVDAAALQRCAGDYLDAGRLPAALCCAEAAATIGAGGEHAGLSTALSALAAEPGPVGAVGIARAIELAGQFRALRGESLLTQEPFFTPRLAPTAGLPTELTPAEASLQRLPRLFATAMMQLADAGLRPKAYKYLGNICLQLWQFCKASAAAELWSAALAMVELRMHADAPADVATQRIYQQLQASAETLIQGSAGAPAPQLMRDVLFYVAIGGAGSKHTTRIRAEFELDSAISAAADAALQSHIEALLPAPDITPADATDTESQSMAEPPREEEAAAGSSALAPESEPEPDPMIVEIFLEEALELIESLEQALGDWVSEGTPAALEQIQRDMHTMKGGARMALQPALADLSQEGERFATELIASKQDAEEVEPQLRHYLQRLGAGVQALAAGEDTAAAMAAVALPAAADEVADAPEPQAEAEPQAESEPVPEPVVPPAEPPLAEAAPQTAPPEPAAEAQHEASAEEDNADPVIVEIFLEEADELLESLDNSLTEWQSSGSEDVLAEIQRQMHTVKGGARMASQTALGNVAHDAETYSLEALQRGDSPDQVAPQLRLAIDKLSAGVAALKTGNNVAVAMAAVAGGAAARPVTTAPADIPSVDVPPPPRAVAQASGQVGKPQLATKAPAQEESLRVPASLLDALTNLSGEAAVARNRVGQQLSVLDDIGEEMRHSTDRLRDAVRNLSGEVEAQEAALSEHTAVSAEQQAQLNAQKQLTLALREATEDLMQLRTQLHDAATDAQQQLEQQTRTDQELQAGLLRARTVPFSRSEARLHRIVRQVSNELGKPVQLQLQNAEGELDRRMLERIIAPLEHMLRNAVDHGIESPERRREAGKSEQGLIRVSFEREGGEIVISIADDGGGINIEAVRNKAIEQGLLEPDAELEDRQVLQYLLKPGFSTATAVTQISGRGVGMDVVNSEIVQLGGRLEVDTRQGRGSTFSMRLPFTLSSNKVLMVRLEDGYYAVAMHALDAVVPVSPAELAYQYNQLTPVIERGDVNYELYYLGDLVASQAPPYLDGRSDQIQVLLMSDGRRNLALHVDSVENAAELTVKTLGAPFAQVPGLVGASVRGDGNVAVVLDVFQLLARFESGSGERSVSGINLESVVADLAVTVLLVDDSLSARTQTAAMLREHGLQVVEKRDGVDAMNWLQTTSRLPQLLITEIALPRMDGYELLAQVGRDERCKGMPLMVISRYLNDESRDRARSQGAGAYMTKPADPAAVLKAISQMTGAVIPGLDAAV